MSADKKSTGREILDKFISELKDVGIFTIDTKTGKDMEHFVRFWNYVMMNYESEVTDEKIKLGLLAIEQ